MLNSRVKLVPKLKVKLAPKLALPIKIVDEEFSLYQFCSIKPLLFLKHFPFLVSSQQSSGSKGSHSRLLKKNFKSDELNLNFVLG